MGIDDYTPMTLSLGKAIKRRVDVNKEEEIKKSLNISDNDLHRIYGGTVFLTFDYLSKIAEIIGSSVTELLDETEISG